MVQFLRTTARFTHVSGNAIDDCINVWHFAIPGEPIDGGAEFAPAITKVNAALQAFYNGFGIYMGESIARTPTSGRLIHTSLNVGGVGAPDDVVSEVISEFNWQPTGADTGAGITALPSEVAVCLSFSGNADLVPESSGGGATRPRARRRGRLYLGPLMTNTVSEQFGSAVVSSAFRTSMLDNYATLIVSINADAYPEPWLQHIVYSPTSGNYQPINQSWMDDQFDTMRSRGMRSTSRDTRNVVQGDLSI